METDSNKAGQNADAFEPQNKTQLAALLGVSVHVLNQWAEAIGEKLGPKIGKLFSSKQVQIMVEVYGRAPIKTKLNQQ